mmetsp:Transcript_17745/g.28884  ORF Transcript_17745/g.28884 Transcript_17745/m.28884 type:complete len:170 (+) Transcript_17745:61-570(+)|eukprot:CAMPEP_0169089028 /NCGR_PEP_ID=MMETSP1015-20121227/15067_1 /TAXON_ID=342587 /ORGANISM="Karlodinium micrum, Strain CCMP2283" /LENGTH=169 /DNA_ID=CAMNT_0009149339 /DNA_START=27 /DNA_END=536 /DNA_ORIENTATION=+
MSAFRLLSSLALLGFIAPFVGGMRLSLDVAKGPGGDAYRFIYKQANGAWAFGDAHVDTTGVPEHGGPELNELLCKVAQNDENTQPPVSVWESEPCSECPLPGWREDSTGLVGPAPNWKSKSLMVKTTSVTSNTVVYFKSKGRDPLGLTGYYTRLLECEVEGAPIFVHLH